VSSREPFERVVRLSGVIGSDGTGTLTIDPQPSVFRAGRGTIQRVIASVPLPPSTNVVNDSFTTAVASGWGTPEVGPPFVVLAGTYSVAAGLGHIAGSPSVQSGHFPISLADVDVYHQVAAIGGNTAALTGTRTLARVQAATDYYMLATTFSNPNITAINLAKRIAGVDTSLAASGVLAIAATNANLRLRIVGASISGTCWAAGTTEPTTPTLNVNDLSITAAGGIGAGVGGQVGVAVDYDNFIGTAVQSQSPIWDAYLGPVSPLNLIDSSVVPASRWIPTLATGQRVWRGEALNIVARSAPAGQIIEAQATIVV
jgi:hypothetical protein